jgi:hypothetical protein
MCSAIFTIIML